MIMPPQQKIIYAFSGAIEGAALNRGSEIVDDV